MLETTLCPDCQGSGVKLMESSSVWGLVKRTTPIPCDVCFGHGRTTSLPVCELCHGHGLIGNEKEICRACNGTGKVDNFALIPYALLEPGLAFNRRCDLCGNDTFEIVSLREEHRVFKSWEEIEELRQTETVERVKVNCSSCPNSYYIVIDKRYHGEINPDQVEELERMGLNLGFLQQVRRVRSSAPQAEQRV